jgi:hypothetical protein
LECGAAPGSLKPTCKAPSGGDRTRLSHLGKYTRESRSAQYGRREEDYIRSRRRKRSGVKGGDEDRKKTWNYKKRNKMIKKEFLLDLLFSRQ